MKIPKNKYQKTLPAIDKRKSIKITYIHLENLVKIKYVIWIFKNLIKYRMVLLKTLVFTHTKKNNKIKNKITCFK